MVAYRRQCRRHAFAGVACSTLVHVATFGLAIGLWLYGLGYIETSSGDVETITVTRAGAIESRDLAKAVVLEAPPEAHRVDGEALLAELRDPRWQEIVEPLSDEQAQHAGTFVSVELARITREAQQRGVDENLSRLSELSHQIHSERSVDDINAQLSKVLQTETRADRPAEEPVQGDFDFATAQLHDVLKQVDEKGNTVYMAVLVDAEGRKFESPMGLSEGETAYRTMNLIKTNPLLERVYRGVVMSMMDQLLKNAK